MTVDDKCTSNGLETAVRTAPAHRPFLVVLSSTGDDIMTFVAIYYVFYLASARYRSMNSMLYVLQPGDILSFSI